MIKYIYLFLDGEFEKHFLRRNVLCVTKIGNFERADSCYDADSKLFCYDLVKESFVLIMEKFSNAIFKPISTSCIFSAKMQIVFLIFFDFSRVETGVETIYTQLCEHFKNPLCIQEQTKLKIAAEKSTSYGRD